MIRGRVIVVGQTFEGVSKSKGTPWKKQEYVIETEGQYPKKVAFSIMNDKIEQSNLQVGNTVEVEIDAQSREYNGRWYTELTAWKINNLGSAAAQQTYQSQPVYQQTAPAGYAAPASQPANQFGQPGNDSQMPF